MATKTDVDALGEYERIGAFVARRSDALSDLAREGFEAQGRGAVFYRELWQQARPEAPPFYLPCSAPEFDDVGREIQRAVVSYRPRSEGVVVVVTRHDEVFVVRLRLQANEAALGARMN